MTVRQAFLILSAWAIAVWPILAVDVVDPRATSLPPGWVLGATQEVPEAEADAIAAKLGTALTRLTRTPLSVQGTAVQIILLETASAAEARRLHTTITGMKNDPAFCLLRDRQVIELYTAEVATAVKVAWELGLVAKPTRVHYRLSAHIATIDRADHAAANDLYQAFLATDTRQVDPASAARIATLSAGFTFGDTLALRAPPEGSDLPPYRFVPAPLGEPRRLHGQLIHAFAQPAELLGVPYVTLTADIVCTAAARTASDGAAEAALLAATPSWPVEDPEIVALAARITVGTTTREDRVQAILVWLTPGLHLRHAGPTGSRWGVQRTLAQGFGHCWDASDCFVTLARAAGIPARQVGGWLYGTGGHIWAEVLEKGGEWRQVEPSGGGIVNCGIYHIPYFTTGTGEMPILYLDRPQIGIVATAEE